MVEEMGSASQKVKVQRLITTTEAKKSGNKSKLFLLSSLVLILVFNLLVKLQREELIEGGFLNMHRFTILPPPSPYLATSNLVSRRVLGDQPAQGAVMEPTEGQERRVLAQEGITQGTENKSNKEPLPSREVSPAHTQG